MCVADLLSSVNRTFVDLLVQYLQEDALINVLHMDEVGVVGFNGLLQTLKLLYRETCMLRNCVDAELNSSS